jgi:hypothetical protein
MAEPSPERDNFLYPRSKFWGDFTPQNLTFNANLQEFAQRISYICNLETAGKMSADEAYREIKDLWKQLKQSKKNLLDQPPLPPEQPESDSP